QVQIDSRVEFDVAEKAHLTERNIRVDVEVNDSTEAAVENLDAELCVRGAVVVQILACIECDVTGRGVQPIKRITQFRKTVDFPVRANLTDTKALGAFLNESSEDRGGIVDLRVRVGSGDGLR